MVRRLDGLDPAAYTRFGAAIRHGAAVSGGAWRHPAAAARRRVRRAWRTTTDTKALRRGDARRALVEARRRGIGCLCLSVGAATDADALRRVFGSAAHATVPRPEQLAGVDRSAVPRRRCASAEVQTTGPIAPQQSGRQSYRHEIGK